MKLKLRLLVVCLVLISTFYSQKNYVIKTEVVMTVPITKMKIKSIITTCFKGEDIKQLTEVNGTESFQYFTGDKVNLVTKEATYKDACGEGTLEEWKALNSETAGSNEYENLKVEKTEKTETILGYLCKKCILTFKVVVPVSKFKVDVVQEVWYSEELFEKGFIDHDPKNIGFTSPVIEALASLKGLVLKQKIKQMGSVMESTVTQIDKAPSNDPIPSLEEVKKDCKKQLTLKKHNEEVQGRHQMQNGMGY